MSKLAGVLWTVGVVLCLAACGGGSDGGASTSNTSATSPSLQYYSDSTQIPISGSDVPGEAPFDQAAKSLMMQMNAPGLALAISQGGKLLLARGYGYSDFEAKAPVKPDSMFRIASLSKMLTSLAIMHLRDQGLLDLDQPVVGILTNYPLGPSADPRVQDITVRELLQHSGGWDRAKVGDFIFDNSLIAQTLAVSSPTNSSDLVQYTLNQPLQFTPGTAFAYSNVGYTILGRVIEKITGQSYESYVREQVLASFNVYDMSIGFPLLSQRGPFEAEYYPYSGEPFVTSDFPGKGQAPAPYATYIARFDSAGGWIASTVDITRIMEAFDASRTPGFLTADSLTQVFAQPPYQSDFTSVPGLWFGLGLVIGPTTATYGHPGDLSGASASVLHVAQGYTIVVLMNTNDSGQPDNSLQGNDPSTVINNAMIQALGSGFAGSPTDLYPQYPSPSLPASGQ